MNYKWKDCFPYPEFREGQDSLIDTVISKFESGTKFVIVEAPTGTGKSAIGYTIGRHFVSYYYITAQKILQTQLSNDFGQGGKWAGNNPMVELKGRNAYECLFYKQAANDPHYETSKDRLNKIREQSLTYVDCSVGECKKQRKSKLKYCQDLCLYYKQYNAAIIAPSVLMNFHSFIFQTEFVPHWGHKRVLIIDEAHNAEQVLMDYVSIVVNDFSYDFELPQYDTAEEYLMYFEDIDLKEIISNKIRNSIKEEDTKKEEYWTHQLFKYNMFKESVVQHEWIPKWEVKEISKGGKKYRQIELKPLHIDDFTEKLLFSKVDHVLLMSATILDVDIMCSALGINKSEVYARRLGSDFPVKNRLIHFTPCGSMSFRTKSATLPIMMKKIEQLCSDHSNERGIIHTHNFEIAKYIQSNASKKLKNRLFFQHNYDSKENMLDSHAKTDDGIIIAPAMHEGLDLKDDLARFQMICKIPYPGLGDNPQLKRRMELNSDYYQYLTALKLVQSYGRCIRSNTDWAKTYILDSDFKSFCNRSSKMLPAWFNEAIIW